MYIILCVVVSVKDKVSVVLHLVSLRTTRTWREEAVVTLLKWILPNQSLVEVMRRVDSIEVARKERLAKSIGRLYTVAVDLPLGEQFDEADRPRHQELERSERDDGSSAHGVVVLSLMMTSVESASPKSWMRRLSCSGWLYL